LCIYQNVAYYCGTDPEAIRAILIAQYDGPVMDAKHTTNGGLMAPHCLRKVGSQVSGPGKVAARLGLKKFTCVLKHVCSALSGKGVLTISVFWLSS